MRYSLSVGSIFVSGLNSVVDLVLLFSLPVYNPLYVLFCVPLVPPNDGSAENPPWTASRSVLATCNDWPITLARS